MKSAVFLVMVAGMAFPSVGKAQFIIGGGGSVVTGGGFSLNYKSRHLAVTGGFGRTTFSNYGYFNPGGFYGYAYANPWFIPPPIVLAPPPVIWAQPIILNVNAEVREPDPERFLVIRPDPKPIAKVEKPAKEVELAAEPIAFPLARGPAANPRIEADRQLEQGRRAFARREYGRALDFFRQAAKRTPDAAAPWFLLAQAQLAIGKYDEATASILAGLKLEPEWPATPLRIRELYGIHPFAFDDHLDALRIALAENRDDPRLQFLLGVQLWFDGRRDEARPLFEQAARLADDAGPAKLFLNVKK